MTAGETRALWNRSAVIDRRYRSGPSFTASFKYGALPVAIVKGGIHEIIEDYDPTMDSGYGFLCYANSPDAFWDSIKGAREIFEQKDVWPMLMERAISRDFSWQMVAERYERVYEQLGLKAVA